METIPSNSPQVNQQTHSPKNVQTNTVVSCSLPIVKQGLLLKKGWKKWYERWFRLQGSSMLFFLDEKYMNLSGSLELKNLEEFEINPVGQSKRFCFQLVLTQRNFRVTHFLAAESEEDKQEWIREIQKNRHSPSSYDNIKTQLQKQPKQVLFSVKERILGKVMNSFLAKTILREFISPDGFKVIDLGKKIINKYSGDPQKGIQFEKVIFNNLTSCLLMMSSQSLTKDDVLLLRDPILQIWSDTLDMLEISFCFDEDVILADLSNLERAFEDIVFFGYEAEKVKETKEMVAYVSNKEFIVAVFTEERFASEKKEMKELLRKLWFS